MALLVDAIFEREVQRAGGHLQEFEMLCVLFRFSFFLFTFPGLGP